MAAKAAAFKRSSAVAVRNPKLQQTLHHVVRHFTEARDAAVASEFPPETWEQMRERASSIKLQTLLNLDFYLDMVDRNVRRNGGHVHFAADAAEANRIVLDIAKRNAVKRVIKSKSMVSEEMRLNPTLEAEGIVPVETDLGEYIIQLAKETPFHIIAPAMHKTRQDVSRLFQDWLRSAPTDDIKTLCAIARNALRQQFATADMGVSGANFVVAETGTVVLVTNEGNGRMTTSVPRVHVALAGMERVIPAIEDVALFLRLLPRSATGQRITSYNSFISGPRRASDEDGPEEFHLVLVDNGRLNLLKDERLREALKCIRCGACLNVCPVYQKTGGHAYGWVYPGPIGAIVTPAMNGFARGADLPFASTLCGACKDVCPVKIDIPKLLLDLRPEAARRTGTWAERLLMRRWVDMMRARESLERSSRLARLMQRPLSREGVIRRSRLPLLAAWTQARDFPAVAEKSFARRWRDGLSRAEP
ncbi:MAG: iron-sulfur cluster-binding protein [SAR202 cluster bacterium]|nr:iron-sulfur cluster-binding protein [SAR202 cluster bacterium]